MSGIEERQAVAVVSEQSNTWGPFPIKDGLSRDRELTVAAVDGEVVYRPGSIVTGMFRSTPDVADRLAPSVQAAADAARKQLEQRKQRES